MSIAHSARQILKSSSIIGGAALTNVIIGLVRNKAAALLVGPAGLGLISLFQSLVTTAAQFGGMGIANAAVRQLAEADGQRDDRALNATRRALFWATAMLAGIAATLFWLFRRPIASLVLGGEASAGELGWIAFAVALTIVASSQQFLLNGLRKIIDIAQLTVGSAILGTILGVAALWLWGLGGILPYVLAAPLAAVLCGYWFATRLEKSPVGSFSRVDMAAQARTLFAFGATVMLGNLVAPLAQLAVRALVGARLGIDILGQFAAASMISMTYIGFILSTMTTDYYPRLAAAMADRDAGNRVINEQSEVALILAGPILLAMQSGVPWIIQLMFSTQFGGATDVLRLYILGDVLRILGWPLGYALLAAGRGRAFFLAEALFGSVFVGIAWLALPRWGLTAIGAAYMTMFAAYASITYILARRHSGFRWSTRVSWTALAIFAGVAVTGLVGFVMGRFGSLFVGLPLTLVCGLYTLHRVSRLAEFGSPLNRVANLWRLKTAADDPHQP